VLPTILTVAALGVLIGLGTWQLQRKAWKDGLLAQIAERMAAPAIPFAEALARARKGEDLEYTRVAVPGRWMQPREWHLWVPTSSGPGWHVYAPLVTAAGPIVIINRGFVPDARREPQSRPEPAPEGDVAVVGLLRKPEVKGTFTPDNAPDRNMWYWRDLAGMAQSLPSDGRAEVAPFFLDAERSAAASPLAPQGGATLLNIPNNHLQYAVTWYGLAATLVGVYAAFAWTTLRRRHEPHSSP
jgi:surfeit locus 1 family protein